MLGRLLALFLITPVVELALLIQLGEYIGFWPTVGVIVLTGITGSYLAKREGLSIWKRFNERLKGGELPGKELLDGVIILVAGALLITPGVLTDLFGFIGLIPFTRAMVRKYLNGRIQRAMERGSVRMTFGGFQRVDRGGGDRGGADVGGRDMGGLDMGGRPESSSAAHRDDWRGRPRDVPGYSRDA